MNSIPVIGTAVVANPYWVHRLIASVDYPVDNFVIFNNNGKGEITEELDSLSKMSHKFIKKITVCHMPSNIGVSGAWNLVIKSYLTAPYWIITNDDVSFGLGFLQEMHQAAQDPEIGMVHGKSGDFDLPNFDLFLIKDWVVQEYGLFDESLYPAYCEDADYLMRFVHRPIKVVKNLKATYYHGLGTEYYKHGSQTKKSSPELERRLTEINEINFHYMNKKWGEAWRQMWPHYTPFNIEQSPISTTSYDLEFARKKHLGF
jgi:GT2 family glycosyltransferase